jgi:hypothetical protein
VRTTPWTKATQTRLGRQAGETFNGTIYRQLVAEFVVESSSAFRIVGYKSYHRLVSYLHANVPLILRRTVQRDTVELKNKLKRTLQQTIGAHTRDKEGGRISLTMDAWTSGNQIPYLGVTGHWIDERWQVRSEALAFKRLRGSHTAENIATVVHNTMSQWNIQDSPRAIMGTMHLSTTSPSNVRRKSHLRYEERIRRFNVWPTF